ncbi:TlpA family protein disulfide reductase [Flavobacterium sp.]|uniref:TlpA family protein disulfide reductase n=1 Tax=Flavobacterium sp. TaxID=239 RepID=UPI0040472910
MKKKLKILIPILIISLLAFMGYKVMSKINHKKQVAENIKKMPNFSYVTLENKVFTQENLMQNKPTLFIYFNSECDFCNHEAEMVQQNIKELKDIQVVFISYENLEKIKSFAAKFKLLHHDNIHFLSDSKITFAATFDVKSMPCLVLYNKENNLIEKIKGQVKIETVLEKFRKF